jgi:hypothetical protein
LKWVSSYCLEKGKRGNNQKRKPPELNGDDNNNRMERFNAELRGREKVTRYLKKLDTLFFGGVRYFVRVHGRRSIAAATWLPLRPKLIHKIFLDSFCNGSRSRITKYPRTLFLINIMIFEQLIASVFSNAHIPT